MCNTNDDSDTDILTPDELQLLEGPITAEEDHASWGELTLEQWFDDSPGYLEFQSEVKAALRAHHAGLLAGAEVSL